MISELVESANTALADDEVERARVLNLFASLYHDIKEEETFPHSKPMLAHYTSVQTLELILKTSKLWLSNPLFMNDTQEMRFPILEGVNQFRLAATTLQEACRTEKKFKLINEAFEFYVDEFMNKDAIDVYIFCLSQHDAEDDDGRLSMWRGYGSDGNGAAIVFDTSKIPHIQDSLLKLGRVRYLGHDDQRAALLTCVNRFIEIIRNASIADNYCYLASWSLFRRIKYFAIMTKHAGFKEEQEWRVIYAPGFDADSPLDELIDYWIGPRGVEPKLKLPLKPLPKVFAPDFDFEASINKIILGPTISSPLSQASTVKMLHKLGHGSLAERLRVSTIPFRSLRP